LGLLRASRKSTRRMGSQDLDTLVSFPPFRSHVFGYLEGVSQTLNLHDLFSPWLLTTYPGMILQVQLSCKTIPDMPRKKAIEANTLLRGLDLDDKMSCQN